MLKEINVALIAISIVGFGCQQEPFSNLSPEGASHDIAIAKIHANNLDRAPEYVVAMRAASKDSLAIIDFVARYETDTAHSRIVEALNTSDPSSPKNIIMLKDRSGDEFAAEPPRRGLFDGSWPWVAYNYSNIVLVHDEHDRNATYASYRGFFRCPPKCDVQVKWRATAIPESNILLFDETTREDASKYLPPGYQ